MGKITLIFILLIPAFVGLGHDIYIYAQDQTLGFHLISLGWSATEYIPDIHKEILDTLRGMEAGFWQDMAIDAYARLLSLSAFVAGLYFAGFWCLIALPFWLRPLFVNKKFIWSKEKIVSTDILGKTKKPMKYKRKK